MNEAIASTCPARGVCRQHNVTCDVTCVGYSELTYQTKLSNIPTRFRTINGKPASVTSAYEMMRQAGTPSALEYRELAKGVLGGGERGMYLWSNTCGTGKSTCGTALLVDYIVQNVGKSLRIGQARSTPYAYYVNFAQFLERTKQMFKDGNESVLNEVNDIQERIVVADIVMMDDVGTTYASESIQERVLSLLEARYGRPTIFTSNCSLNQLEDKLGQRNVSRIYGMTHEIHVKGTDHRREATE